MTKYEIIFTHKTNGTSEVSLPVLKEDAEQMRINYYNTPADYIAFPGNGPTRLHLIKAKEYNIELRVADENIQMETN
tara:strand:+ start:281 stop:511 length:231 start_codon:yes stop_codon:yes gene_type:complete